ncbi:MAG: hypothetical protein EZS28_024876, partial [Streblomastix strix]
MKDCSTKIEQMLLEILELIAEKGNQQYDGLNSFFHRFNDTGLLYKIINLMKQKICLNKNATFEFCLFLPVYAM